MRVTSVELDGNQFRRAALLPSAVSHKSTVHPGTRRTIPRRFPQCPQLTARLGGPRLHASDCATLYVDLDSLGTLQSRRTD